MTPVKGMRIHEVESIDLSPTGARGNRAFFVIDARGRMVNGKVVRNLQVGRPRLRPRRRRADAHLPGRVAGRRAGSPTASRSRPSSSAATRPRRRWSARGRGDLGVLRPPAAAGRRRTRGRPRDHRDRFGRLARIAAPARRAGRARRDRRPPLPDADRDRRRRRPRGGRLGRPPGPGRSGAAGDARPHRPLPDHQPRRRDRARSTCRRSSCWREYRREIESTEPLPFGIYGEVLEGGTVRIGDAGHGRRPDAVGAGRARR